MIWFLYMISVSHISHFNLQFLIKNHCKNFQFRRLLLFSFENTFLITKRKFVIIWKTQLNLINYIVKKKIQ